MKSSINKINLLSAAFTSPFLDYLCSFTASQASAATLYTVFQTMHHRGLNHEVILLLQLLCDVTGISLPTEIAHLNTVDTASACFVAVFLADTEDYLQDIM
jgi:hypothetical protein